MESTPTEETVEEGVRDDDGVHQGRRRRRRRVVVVVGGLMISGAVFVTFTTDRRRRLTPSLMTTSIVRRYNVGGYDNKGSWLTGEDLRTKAGVVPSITCQPGRYRPTGASDNNYQRLVSLRADGCADCPRGRYGDMPGLLNEFCSADCPSGRFRDTPGAKSEDECHACPPGTYGASLGLTTNKCTAKCPAGKYSNAWGQFEVQDCKDCPEGARFSASATFRQCRWEIVPQRFARGHIPGTSWTAVHHYDLDTKPAAKIMANRGALYDEVGIRLDHPGWFARQHDKIYPHPKAEYAGVGADPDRAPAQSGRVPGLLAASRPELAHRASRPLPLRLPFKFPLRNTGYPKDDD